MKLELAKTGNHNGISITTEDIQDMEQTFCGEVPVTIGHEMDDTMPAYGWVHSVSADADGEILTAELELSEELSEAFANGKYKNWSIGAGRDEEGQMYLHHVAFLGAVPPMIKDLRIIEMGDTSEIITLTAKNCSAVLSDTEAREYIYLKKQEKQEKLKKLSDATAGKLPFSKREELISFADSHMSRTNGSYVADFLTEIFSAVKPPVKEGLSALITSKRAENGKSIFRKI